MRDASPAKNSSTPKIIELHYKPHLLDEEGWEFVRRFNDSFKPSDIVLNGLAEDRFTLVLRAVDMTQLRDVCATLSAPNVQPLFQEIVTAVESIKSYGLKGKKRSYVDYNKERKTRNRKQKEGMRRKHYYAKENGFTKENHSFPKAFENKIICDDSERILTKLPANSVDLILTSPPYNFGLDYQGGDDTAYWEDYFTQLFAIFGECIRALKYGGRLVVNVQPLFSDYIPSHHIIGDFFMRNKLIWKGEILWEKNNYNCKYTAWGSWRSPSNPYLKYTWEFIEVFCKGDLKKPGKKEDIDITADEFKQWTTGKWSIAPERRMKEFDHPAMFPEELAARVLKLFSYRNDLILDPFNGVGTTTLVAHRLGRRYCGIDVIPKYCRIAQHRINKGSTGNSSFIDSPEVAVGY